MTVLDARETLVRIAVADFPWKKKEDRMQIHRQLHRQAYPADSTEVLTTKELARRLGAAINVK